MKRAFDVVAVAASAGGIEALASFLAVLPKEFPAAVLIVQHLPSAARYKSALVPVLQRATRLPVKWAEDSESLLPGTVYLAPQDRHMLVNAAGELQLRGGPKVNHVRPAADVLFSSIAAHFGPRAIAVVLSGTLRDGARGAWSIARNGGRVLVQDQLSSRFFDMPRAAVEATGFDFMFAPRILAHVLIALVMAAGAADWFRVWRVIPSQFEARSPTLNPVFNSPA